MTTAVSDAPPVAGVRRTGRVETARRRRAVGVVADLYLWEVLVACRLPWSLRSFRRLVVAGVSGGCLVLWTAAAVVAQALVDIDDPTLSLAVVAATVLVLTYLSTAHVVRDVLSGLNPAVPHDPRHALVVALDLPFTVVALVYTVTPRLPLAVAGTGVVAGLAVPVAAQVGLGVGPLALLTSVPLLLAAAGAVAVAALSTQRARRVPTARTLAALGGLSVVLGLVTGHLVTSLRRPGSPGTVDPHRVMGWVLPEALVLLGVVVLGTLVLAGGRLERLATRPAPTDRPEVVGRRTGLRPVLGRGLLREIESAPTFPVVRNIVVGSGCGVLALLGAVAAGLSLTGLPPDRVRTVALGVVVTMTLALTEALSRPVGPVRLALPMRTLWELGASRRQLAQAATAAYWVPVGASLALSATGYALVTGSWALAPVVAHVLALAAWVLAECLVPPLTNPDGSAMYNAVTGVAIVTLTAPVLLLTLTPSAPIAVLVVLYCVLLTGGAFTCLSRRVLSLPSVSTR